MPSPLTYPPIVDGATAAVAATWNSRYQPLYDQVNAHVTNATVGSATAQNHTLDAILSLGALPVASGPIQNPGNGWYAIDMLATMLKNITGTGTVGNFSTVTVPATLAALNSALTGVTGGATTVPFAGGIKGPTAGRLLVGAGAGAMTELVPGTSGNVAQSNGAAWVSAALAGTSFADGSVPFGKLTGGFLTAATLTLTMAADKNVDGSGHPVNIASQTYTFDGAGGRLSPPGFGSYRTDLVQQTTAGALSVLAGSPQSTAALADSNAPALTSTSGKLLGLVHWGPSATAIGTTGPATTGVAWLEDFRVWGYPSGAFVAGGSSGGSSITNATSSASVTTDVGGSVTATPTGGNYLTVGGAGVQSTAGILALGSAYYTPAANATQFNVHTRGPAGETPGILGGTYEGLRSATWRFDNTNMHSTDNVILDLDWTHRSRTLGGIAPGAAGSGYTSAPTVTVTATGTDLSAPLANARTAVVTATVSGGTVTGYTIVDPGQGYRNVPTIAVTGGGGSGATATALLSGVTRTGMHIKGFQMPDQGESSNLLSVSTGGGTAGVFYKASTMRPAGYEDYAMSPQGAIETGTADGSQAVICLVGGPVGPTLQQTGMLNAIAINATVIDFGASGVTGWPVPGSAIPNMPGSSYPPILFGRIYNPSATVQEWFSYTGVSGNTLTGVVKGLGSTAVAWAAFGGFCSPAYAPFGFYTRLDEGVGHGNLVEAGNAVWDRYRIAYAVGSKQGNAPPVNVKYRVLMDGSFASIPDGGVNIEFGTDSTGHPYTKQTTGPTVLTGTAAGYSGAGTGATYSLAGTDTSGFIILTTGTAPATGSNLFQLVFNKPRDAAPNAAPLFPGNGSASGAFGSAACPFLISRTTTGVTFSSNTVALTASTAYIIYYIVM